MKTAAELWKEYRPKLSAAKEEDRREAQEVFLRIPTHAGGVWIEPITIERFLILDALDHPILTGEPLEREDLLNLLWIISPDYVAGDPGAAKKFFRRFWFTSLEEAGVAIAGYLDEQFSTGTQSSKKSDPPHNWVALLVDTLASEYGWTEDEITEALLHVGGYIGVPTIREAMIIAGKVFKEMNEEEGS